MATETTARIYADGTYLDATGGSWHAKDSVWKAGNVLRILSQNGIRPQSLADVGCGAGVVLKTLSADLVDCGCIHGYDISPDAIKLTTAHQTERVDYMQRDLLADPAIDKYDALLALDVFEHVEDYMGFLRQLKERAAWKIFHVPLDLSAQAVLRGKPILHARRTVGHLHYFSKDTALTTLTDCGYDICDYFYTAAGLEAPRRRLKTKLAGVPRWLTYKISPDFASRALGGFSLMVLAK